MEIKTISTSGWEGAVRGMREPFKSFDKNDSAWDKGGYVIGENDLDLCHRLLKAGASDAKFLRYIHVQAEITAPQYFMAELDTYKVATTRNSSSIQHIGAKRDYMVTDFAIDHKGECNNPMANFSESVDDLMTVCRLVNKWRTRYKETNDYECFRVMRQLMPMGFEYTIMWDANYQTLRNIYCQRILRPHRLKEWTETFSNWIDSLPYADDLIKYGLGKD